MKQKTHEIRILLMIGALVLAAALAFAQQPLSADEQAQTPTGEENADDLATEEKDGIRYEEYRVGGRLEQIIVPRESGLVETYRNKRADTLWAAEENELGEVPNMRQWILGTW